MTSEVKNRGNKREPAKTKFESAQFINHSFDAAGKAAFKEWCQSVAGQTDDLIDKVVDDGYRLTVKPDSYSGGVACWLQPVAVDNRNAGYILSGRARSGSMAILSVLFRHYVVFEADWPTDVANRNDFDDD